MYARMVFVCRPGVFFAAYSQTEQLMVRETVPDRIIPLFLYRYNLKDNDIHRR